MHAEQFITQESIGFAGFQARIRAVVRVGPAIEPPCGESSEREIVVCAAGEEVQRHDPPEPQQEEGFKPEIQLSENAKAGLHAEPGRDGAVEALVELTIKF